MTRASTFAEHSLARARARDGAKQVKAALARGLLMAAHLLEPEEVGP
jgi:hypothetical protein